MTTEAQKARNARKRAKLRAHRAAQRKPIELRETATEPGYRWDVAVRGIKGGFRDCDLDAVLDQPDLPSWVMELDYVEISLITSQDVTLSEAKQLAREAAEDIYGFNKWDCECRVAFWGSTGWGLYV